MYCLVHMPCCNETLNEYKDARDLQQFYQQYGCDGLEMIYAEEDTRKIITPSAVIGLHMSFYPYWIDFWNNNEAALIKEFNNRETYEAFYNGKDRESLINLFKADLERAQALNVRYVVFHVSNVSVRESYTYEWGHSDQEVIEAAIEVINTLLDGSNYTFDFLMENLWWPGFSMTNPNITKELLEGVHYARKGLLLDIGHLMNTNLNLQSQEEACTYMHHLLDAHGDLCSYIKGVHLHQSVTGNYVKEAISKVHVLEDTYTMRFARAYEHIGKIDTHRPMTCKEVKGLIERIGPEYLVYELVSKNRKELSEYLEMQYEALK